MKEKITNKNTINNRLSDTPTLVIYIQRLQRSVIKNAPKYLKKIKIYLPHLLHKMLIIGVIMYAKKKLYNLEASGVQECHKFGLVSKAKFSIESGDWRG